MAPTALTSVVLTHTSATLLDAANWSAGNAVDGNTIVNDGSTFVGLNNSGASTRLVNVRVTRQVDGLSIASTARQYSLTAGEIRIVKLGPVSDYSSSVLFTPAHAEVKIRAFTV